MNTTTWICCILPWLVVYYIYYKRKKAVKQHIKSRIIRKNKGEDEMTKVIETYMNQAVQVNTVDGAEYGRLVNFEDGWVTLNMKGKEIHLNQEYIISVREYNGSVDKKQK